MSPRFLTRVVKALRRSGLDLVSLDEMHRRLTEGDFSRRFVCLTFDDGYRDMLQYAYPILKEAGVPFAIYVATSFPDRLGELWWLALEAVIARNDRIGLSIDGRDRKFDCRTVAEKRALYDELYWWLRAGRRKPNCAKWCAISPPSISVDIAAFCSELCMSWRGIRGACRRSAGHHRRAYREPSDAGETDEETVRVRNGFEPLGDRGGAGGAAAASVLSVSATALPPARANSRSPPNSASRPR